MSLCHFHPDTIAQNQCTECEIFLCKKCIKKQKNNNYCKDCLPEKKSGWKHILNVIGEAIAAILGH